MPIGGGRADVAASRLQKPLFGQKCAFLPYLP
jgi:hypothetical protein